jgi:hypothetical protein
MWCIAVEWNREKSNEEYLWIQIKWKKKGFILSTPLQPNTEDGEAVDIQIVDPRVSHVQTVDCCNKSEALSRLQKYELKTKQEALPFNIHVRHGFTFLLLVYFREGTESLLDQERSSPSSVTTSILHKSSQQLIVVT